MMRAVFFNRVWLGCLLLVCGAKLSAATIFVVDSYHANYVWTAECRQGLEATIDGQHRLIYAEMDTKRTSPARFSERADVIWQQIKQIKPDLVITMDDNALKYFGERVSQSGTPVVFMGINQNPRQYFQQHKLPPNVTGALERISLKQYAAILGQLMQAKKHRVKLLMDDGLTSHAVFESLLDGQNHLLLEGVELNTVIVSTFEAWQSHVNTLLPNGFSSLLITSYATLKNEHGEHVPAATVLEWTNKHSKVPLFAFWRHAIGKGKAVGGPVNSAFSQGESAARIANTILATGEIPYVDIPVSGEYQFSQHELLRWNIRLPHELSHNSEMVE